MKKLFITLFILTTCCLVITACKSTSDHTHEFGEWTIISNATCTEVGEKERICTCGKKETRVIDKVDHIYADATCTAPQKCIVCGQTQGTALPHNTNPKTGYCLECGTFEYTIIRAARGAVESALEQINTWGLEYYKFLNFYYVSTKECACFKCLEKEDAGEPYVSVVIFWEYYYEGEYYKDVLILGVHKYYSPETDTYHMIVTYNQAYYYQNDGDELTEVYAADYSYYFDESKLILIPKADVL